MSGFDAGVLHSAQKLAIEHGLNFHTGLNKPFRHLDLYKILTGLSRLPFPSSGQEAAIHIPVEQELRNAITEQQLEVHYQPKIDLKTGNITSLEALVRWHHPEHGMLRPDLFIPFAEQTGLIDQLTWSVLHQAANQCQQWNEMGIGLSIAVNMSASTLRELDLPEYLNNLITSHAIHPCQIILEVTETALMQELVKTLDILTRLRMKGFMLSIDDFGTGYSSLVQLHRAPFSELKIDRSFIHDMSHDKEAQAIVETVIVLGHKLGMQIVAEGVETQSDLDQLIEMGCDLAQGFYFSRPLNIEAITNRLIQHPVASKA